MAEQKLTDLAKFIFGTAQLRDQKLPFDQRVAMARLAMNAVDWFHTSHQYGDTLQVLRRLRSGSCERAQAHRQDRLEHDRGTAGKSARISSHWGWTISTSASCASAGGWAMSSAPAGNAMTIFCRLKAEGLVKRFVVEVFPWTSAMPLEGLRGGFGEDVIDAYIFYLNPLQRFASNALWDLLQERGKTIIAMRTVGGGDVHRLRDVPGAAWNDYLRQRAVEVAPIYERSGCRSWPEFCIRFSFDFPAWSPPWVEPTARKTCGRF